MPHAEQVRPGYRARAVRLVIDHRGDYPSEWAVIKAVSKRLGMNAETMRNWIRQQQVDDGQRDGVSTEATKEVLELRRRNAELEETVEVLRAAPSHTATQQRIIYAPVNASSMHRSTRLPTPGRRLPESAAGTRSRIGARRDTVQVVRLCPGPARVGRGARRFLAAFGQGLVHLLEAALCALEESSGEPGE